jgi:SAM-dependent methyltransferase
MAADRVGGTPRRQWVGLARRILTLLWHQPQQTADLVSQSYNAVAAGYDDAWTHHMRGFTLDMLDRLAPANGAAAIDLTCGTGFATRVLAQRTARRAVGVDASTGMLAIARRDHGSRCDFIHADALQFLRTRPDRSADVITCCWGLGYSRPWPVIREAARVLRPGGRLGVIDNTLFSLAGVMWASIQTFAETPDALRHVMRVQFLPGTGALKSILRLHGLGIVGAWSGTKTYFASDGADAVRRLQATGAAAGFEHAANPEHRDAVFTRFAEILETHAGPDARIAITHRYLAAIGLKP